MTTSKFTTSKRKKQNHANLQCCPAYRITLKIGPRSLETDMSLSLFPSSSTSCSSSLSRRWRMPLVSGLPLPLPAVLPPRLALAAMRRADVAGVGEFTSVGVKKTPSCLQVNEANFLFMMDSANLVNWKKMKVLSGKLAKFTCSCCLPNPACMPRTDRVQVLPPVDSSGSSPGILCNT